MSQPHPINTSQTNPRGRGFIKRLLPLVVLLFLLASTFVLRTKYLDPAYEIRRNAIVSNDVLLSPGPELLALSSFEHPYLWADFLWLGIVQTVGKCMAENGSLLSDCKGMGMFSRIERWAHIATDLDPKYFSVYHASAILLTAWGKDPERSDTLLLKGQIAMPERWEFPFLLGYNAYFLRGDARTASEYFLMASTLKDSPRFLASLAGRARYQAGDESGAIDMLEMLLQSLGEGPAKADVEARLMILKSEPILKSYDEACAAFKNKQGRIPTAEELYRLHLVDVAPYDLVKNEIRLDEGCRARTKLIEVREDEARERIGSQKRASQ